MDTIGASSGQPQAVRGEFTGSEGQFFRLALIGNLLMIPTFAFYRFWLTTDIRRHLWCHTRIGGEGLEYTGRGRELLIGFLIAMAILTPLYTAYFLLSLEAERWQAFASVPLFLIIYVLMHYGSYRARRYRATRTMFRGVRLWMTGSGWAYAARAILWDLLTAVSLGLAFPWRASALERYRMSHTHFGDVPGSFAGRGWVFFKRGWWLWLSVMLLVVLLLMFSSLQAVFTLSGMTQTMPLTKETSTMATVIGLLLWIPVLIFGYPFYRAIAIRWRLEGIRFGGMSMTSDLKKRSVLWAYGKAMLIGSVAIGVGGIIVQVAMDSVGFSFESLGNSETPPISVLALLIGFYILALLGFAIVNQTFITRGVWQLAVDSVTVFNLGALDDAVARGAAVSGLGEGLADALDFGGGIGI